MKEVKLTQNDSLVPRKVMVGLFRNKQYYILHSDAQNCFLKHLPI